MTARACPVARGPVLGRHDQGRAAARCGWVCSPQWTPDCPCVSAAAWYTAAGSRS